MALNSPRIDRLNAPRQSIVNDLAHALRAERLDPTEANADAADALWDDASDAERSLACTQAAEADEDLAASDR